MSRLPSLAATAASRATQNPPSGTSSFLPNTNITNNGNGNINTGNIGTVENTTNVQNTFSIQTIPINLANAITGDSRRKETVKGTT